MKKINFSQSQKPSRLWIRKSVSGLLILTLLSTQLLHVQPVYGDPEKTKVNIVAILVEKSLDDNSTRYDGLGLFGVSTLSERIARYAQDIQSRLENTKTLIYLVDKNEQPYEIAKVLEKLYFEGDGTQNEMNNLEGVVLIGDVPLPTVRKENHAYPSLYPYTDFKDKQFIYNPLTAIFEATEQALETQPEIWHGVIKPPVQGAEGNQLLALYLDKNHAFYQKVGGYADFDQKVFFADVVREPDKVQGSLLKSYEAFLAHWEDIAYLRYTKELAQTLTTAVQGDIHQRLQASGINTNTNNSNLFDLLPDIMSKQIVDRLLARFGEVMGSYPGDVQNLVAASGRWSGQDADTFAGQITAKDEFTLRMLKKANDLLEAKTDQIAQELQRNVLVATSNNFLNGRSAADITQAVDCSIYRGSPAGESAAQQVEANRVYNPGNEPNKCDAYGGCCGKNMILQNGKLVPSPSCNPDRATQSVFDLGGTLERSGADTSYQACLRENYPRGQAENTNTREISSVVYHKEPTGETIAAQLQSKFAQALPIDDPRYVDFQDHNGEYRRLDYLNFFSLPISSSSSPEASQNAVDQLLQNYEASINRTIYDIYLKRYGTYLNTRLNTGAVPPNLDRWEQNTLAFLKTRNQKEYPGGQEYLAQVDYFLQWQNNEADYEQDLSQITRTAFPNLSADSLLTFSSFIRANGSGSVFVPSGSFRTGLETELSASTLADGAHWRSLSLSDKYRYVFTNYLAVPTSDEQGQYNDIYPAKRSGYESVYLNLPDQNQNFLDLSFNPQSSGTDAEFEDVLTAMSLKNAKDQISTAHQNLLNGNEHGADLTLDQTCGSWDGVDLWEWFSAIQCWLQEMLPPKVELAGDDEGDTFNASSSSSINTPLFSSGNADNNNNSPSLNMNSSSPARITRIELEPSEIHLNTLDEQPAFVTATLLDQDGEVYVAAPESALTFQVEPAGEDPIVALSQGPVQNGTSRILVSPRKAGSGNMTVSVSGVTASLPVRVYDRKIDLSFSSAQAQASYGTTFPVNTTVTAHMEILDEKNDTPPATGNIRLELVPQTAGVSARITGATMLELIEGRAEGTLNTGTKTGTFLIRAIPSDPQLAPGEALVIVTGGTPSALLLKSEVSALAGNSTRVGLQILDQDGNPVVGNYDVSLFINENGVITDLADEDPDKEGLDAAVHQTDRLLFTVTPTNKGPVNLKVRVAGVASDASLTLQNFGNDLKVIFQAAQNTLPVGSTQTLPIHITVVDAQGSPVDVDQAMELQLDSTIATLHPSTVQLEHGKATTQLKSGTRAGTVKLSPKTMPSEPLNITLTSAPATKLAIRSDQASLQANGQDSTKVYVSVLDEFGNVATNYQEEIKLNLTPATQSFGQLSFISLQPTNGEADFSLSSTLQAGQIHLIARSGNLTPAGLAIDAQVRLGKEDIQKIPWSGLYTTILGIPAGDVTRQDYLGGWMLFNSGKMQTLTSMIQSGWVKKEYAHISPQGLQITGGEQDLNFKTQVIPHQNQPLEIQVRENNSQVNYLSAFLEPPKNLEHKPVVDFNNLSQAGIYLLDTDLGDTFSFKKDGQQTIFLLEDQTVGNLSAEGYLGIESPLLIELDHTPQNTGFTLDLILNDTVVGAVQYYVPDWQITALAEHETREDIVRKGPGIYPALYTRTMHLSPSGKGLSLLSVSEEQKIDEPYQSMEDSDAQEGIGWQGDFKNELLFAGGNTVGESTKWYASSLLINLGDPVIALPRNNQTGLLGYTQDVGKMLASYQQETIYKILPLDYNRDNQTDILVVLQNGQIDLLQNSGNGHEFKPMGTILSLQDGIESIQTADVNADGWPDMLGSSKSGNVFYIENQGGAWKRTGLELDLQARVTDLQVKDMDQDKRVDLVLADDNGDISILYGSGTGFEPQRHRLDNVGIKVSDVNLNDEPVVYFAGLPAKDPANPQEENRYVSMAYESAVSNLSLNSNSAETGFVESSRDFMKLNLVTGLVSEKKIRDLNSGNLQLEDTVEYTITIQNSGASISDLALADFLPDFVALENTSVVCEGCGSNFSVLPASHLWYPLMLGGITLPAGQTAIITYRATVTNLPKAVLETGDFEQGQDPYLDIYIRDGAGNSDTMVLLSSTGSRTYERSLVDNTISSPEDGSDTYQDENNNGVPDSMEQDDNGDGIPNVAQQELDRWTEDQDEDGIPDGWDDYADSGQSTADLANSTRNRINQYLRGLCPSGSGCMSLPINYAFLAPGNQTISLGSFSKRGLFVPGMILLGIKTTPTYVCFGPSCYTSGYSGPETPTSASSVSSDTLFRLYAMPTLTGGLGIGLCLGPIGTGIRWPAVPLTGNCFVTAVPIADTLSGGACTQLTVALSQMIANAKSAFMGQGGRGIFRVGYSAGGTRSNQSAQVSFNNGVFGVNAIQMKNIRPPSFPKFIMDWVDRQIEEITRKLTDLPTIYLILPDFTDVLGKPSDKKPENSRSYTVDVQQRGKKLEKKEVQFIGDIVDYLNALPFVNVRVQSLPVKYPKIGEEQLRQLRESWEIWLEEMEEKMKEYENIDESPEKVIRLQAGRALINRVRNNLRTLSSYADFPKQIEEFAQWKTKLIRQVVVYLDLVSNTMGSYYMRNKLRLIKWTELFILIKSLLEGWQQIPQIFLKFRDSCSGSCTNDRGNAMDWYLQLFSMLIPSLPVIPLPKWPDIVLDVSHINAVLDITIPSPKFIEQDLVIPRLPEIELGMIGLDFDVDAMIPKLPVLPNLPDLFPKLPRLALPKLPDLPPPPKIPQLLGSFKSVLQVLDLALYVWCLYKKGLPLVKEWELKPTVENMTERSGFLPGMDFLQLSFPEPKLPFIDQIRVDTYVNLNLPLRQLYDFARQVTDPLNKIQTNLLRAPNLLPSSISPAELLGNDDLSFPVAQLQTAVKDLQQEIKENQNTLVTAEEMRELLEQQLTGLEDLPPNSALSELKTTLQKAIASSAELEVTTPPINQKTLALKQTMLDLLAEAETEENQISRAIQDKRDLFAVGELEHIFLPNQNVLAATNTSGSPVMTEEATFSNAQDLNIAPPDAAPMLAASTLPYGEVPVPAVNMEGLYVYHDKIQQPERLIAYAYENGASSVVALADLDLDGDEDVLYTLQGNLYAKENLEKKRPAGNHFSAAPAIRNLAEHHVAHASINYFRAQAGTNTVSMNWLPDTAPDVIGYVVTFKPVINRFDLEQVRTLDDPPANVFFALPGQEEKIKELFPASQQAGSQLHALADPASPGATIELLSGNYYGKIKSLLAEKQVGTLNEIHLHAPQRYGDTTPPVALVRGGNVQEVPVLQTVTLDASISYASGGKIASYFWDMDPGTDSDGDGMSTNDPDRFSELQASANNNSSGEETVMNDPTILLGPFDQLGEKRIVLNVVDDAGNLAQTEVVLNVFVPNLFVDQASRSKRTVSGHTDQPVKNEPVALVRVRNNSMKIVQTPSANAQGKYLTDESGSYAVSDLNQAKGLLLKDRDGKEVAYINEETGRVVIKDQSYVLGVSPATHDAHTRINIIKAGEVVASVSIVTDPNRDVLIASAPPDMDAGLRKALEVWDKDSQDTVTILKLPGNAPSFPGGAVVYDSRTRTLLAMIGTNGGIQLLDNSLLLTLKPAAQDTDPVVLEVRQQDTSLLEVYLPAIGNVTIE